MGDEGRPHSPVLIEYRLRKVEEGLEDIQKILPTLATKADITELKAASTKTRDWWNNTIVGPLFVAIVVVVVEVYLKHT